MDNDARREDEIARMMEVFIFASDEQFEMMMDEVEIETRREDEHRDTTLEQEAVRKQE